MSATVCRREGVRPGLQDLVINRCSVGSRIPRRVFNLCDVTKTKLAAKKGARALPIQVFETACSGDFLASTEQTIPDMKAPVFSCCHGCEEARNDLIHRWRPTGK